MYGHRARIGYTSPPLTTEIFPYEFYKIVPDGVTLVVTSLAIVVRSKDEVDQSYDISMRAAREMAAAGCDIVVLGGVPINLSRGAKNAEQMIARPRGRARRQGVVERGRAGARRQGARLQEGRGGAALRPFRHRPHRAAMPQHFGCEVLGATGWGSPFNQIGAHPAARRDRDGPQADARASGRRHASCCRRRTGRPPARSTRWRRSSAST